MVTSKPTQWAEVDEQGRLVLPPGMAARFGLTPGARLRLEDDDGKVLSLIHISEPTRPY